MDVVDQAEGTISVINDGSATLDAAETSTTVSEKKLLRKIDGWLLPFMVVSYMLQFLDKQSLSQSSIMGFIVDLKLTGNEYSWCGSIFYFGYLTLSYPASLLMVKLPIGKYLAANFLIWGIILACHAATKNFTGIMIARFFLGAAEAAVSPGFSMITGMWYKREEQPLRHGLWFAGNSIATAFGGLLAYGIAHITGSFAAWRWMYIIYGLITLFWAIALFLFLPDSPSSARFLNEREGQEASDRLRVNQTGLNDNTIKWEQVWEALKDYKIWMLFFYQIANNIPNGGLTTFTGLVLEGFGFTILQVYLLSMPMGVIHAFFAIGGLIGCILVYATDNKGPRLFGLFIFVAFAAGLPLTLSMVSSNVSGYTKKATVTAMMFIAYCTGNIIGPFLFFSDEAPRYQSGFLAVIVCLAAAIVLILALGLSWRWENAKRDRIYGPRTIVPVVYDKGGSVIELQESVDTTDVKNHGFRYVY
ncbi:pantothenate transporter [Penicillium verhagenii]|nr:pantothenate transporter [Penicillium verhagenii]